MFSIPYLNIGLNQSNDRCMVPTWRSVSEHIIRGMNKAILIEP